MLARAVAIAAMSSNMSAAFIIIWIFLSVCLCFNIVAGLQRREAVFLRAFMGCACLVSCLYVPRGRRPTLPNSPRERMKQSDSFSHFCGCGAEQGGQSAGGLREWAQQRRDLLGDDAKSGRLATAAAGPHFG